MSATEASAQSTPFPSVHQPNLDTMTYSNYYVVIPAICILVIFLVMLSFRYAHLITWIFFRPKVTKPVGIIQVSYHPPLSSLSPQNYPSQFHQRPIHPSLERVTLPAQYHQETVHHVSLERGTVSHNDQEFTSLPLLTIPTQTSYESISMPSPSLTRTLTGLNSRSSVHSLARLFYDHPEPFNDLMLVQVDPRHPSLRTRPELASNATITIGSPPSYEE